MLVNQEHMTCCVPEDVSFLKLGLHWGEEQTSSRQITDVRKGGWLQIYGLAYTNHVPMLAQPD